MKKLIFCVALLGYTLALSAQSATDEADMHTFARHFMAAYNAGDHAALEKMYTADAVRIDPEGKEIEGADKIATFFAEQFRLNNATLLIRQQGLHWSDAEHAWVATGSYELYGVTNVYDIAIDITGQYANTMLKVDGEWKIAQSVLSEPVPATSDNVAVVDGIYRAFSTGDIPAVLGALAPGVVWNEAEGNALADGNPYIGPDAVLNGVFMRLGAEHEYFKLKDIQLHPMENNQVLATLRYDAKRKDTGNRIDAQAAHLWTLRDGQVVAFQQYVDTHQLAMAAQRKK